MFPLYLLEINGFNNTLFNERNGTKGTVEVGNKAQLWLHKNRPSNEYEISAFPPHLINITNEMST